MRRNSLVPECACTAVLLFFSAALPVSAQKISFTSDTGSLPLIHTAPGCCVVAAADFNGDGKPDLIIADAVQIAFYANVGNPGFSDGIAITNFGRVSALFAVDVNRDGKLDLVVGADGVHVLLGNGDGTFQSATQVASGVPMFVSDLNGDGKPDLAVSGGGALCEGQLYLGNGDGSFQRPVSCLPQPDAMGSTAAVGDINADGIPDFAWANARSSGRGWILLGNGDGTFRLGYEFHQSGAFVIRSLATSDLNHDGKLDLVAASQYDGSVVTVLLGNGDGTFQDSVAIPLLNLPSEDFGYRTLVVADLNGDNKLDIAKDNAVILGNGDGTFQTPHYLQTASIAATLVATADLNSDKRLDLIFADYDLDGNASSVSYLLNNTPGPDSSVIAYPAPTGLGPVAPASIASIYGQDLARNTASADGPLLPMELGGIRIRVRDSSNTLRFAPLLYVSPTQINFLVPYRTALGPAVVTVDDGSATLVETADATAVTQIAPGVFTADGKSNGIAAATATRILGDGTQQPVEVFTCCVPGQCATVPIDLASGPVYLSLYGTGFRDNPNLYGPPYNDPPPQCEVGGMNAMLSYLGAQPSIPGLDQINMLLPPKLPSGVTSVECQFSLALAYGPLATSNTVAIEIK